MHGGRARRQTGAHAARGSMSRMRHPTPSLSLFLFLFVVNVHGVWGEDDPDELFNDDPEKSIENDDELECPWDQEGQVGLEDPNPCRSATCYVGNGYINTALNKCAIQPACCPILIGYCEIQPGDVQCQEGSHHMNLFSTCAYDPARMRGCPRITTTTTKTKTTTTKKPFSTTSSTTTTRTTPPTVTSTTYTATTRTISSRESTTTITTTTTRCLGGDIVDPYTQLTSVYWKCFSGNQCVVQRFTCDGQEDCADGSDELYCGCTDGSCTPESTTTVTTSTTTRTTSTTSTSTTSTVTTSTATTTTGSTTTRSGTTTTRTESSTTTTYTTRTMSVITLAYENPTTATATTKTAYHADNVDCEEVQDPCTAACEWSYQRNYKVLVPQGRRGKACAGPTDCNLYYKNISGVLFPRGCTPPPTTTTATTVTTIPVVVVSIADTANGTADGLAAAAADEKPIRPGMVVLGIVIAVLLLAVAYLVLKELGYVPDDFWTRLRAWFAAKWAALTLCCCGPKDADEDEDADADKADVVDPPPQQKSSEVAETEFDLLAKGLMKDENAKIKAKAKAASKFTTDSDDGSSDEEGEEFGPSKPDAQAAQLATPLLDHDSSDDEEAILAANRAAIKKAAPGVVQLGGATQEGTTDEGSTVLYSDAGSGGRFTIPMEEMAPKKPGVMLLGGTTTEGTQDDGQTVLYDSASGSAIEESIVLEGRDVNYAIPMVSAKAGLSTGSARTQNSWVGQESADPQASSEDFYDLATLAGGNSAATSGGGGEQFYEMASPNSAGGGGDDGGESSIYLTPGSAVNFDSQGESSIYATPVDAVAGAQPTGAALYDMASTAGPAAAAQRHVTQRRKGGNGAAPPTPAAEDMYSLAAGGAALHATGQFIIPMAEDAGETVYSSVLEEPPPLPTKAADGVDAAAEDFYDVATLGGSGAAAIGGDGEQFYTLASPEGPAHAEDTIYSTSVEAPAGEVLYDAASPGGPPPPLPTKGGGGSVNPEPTYPQPPPGEELYSLATEGAALHVQSAGAGQQFVVPMAEGDGGGAGEDSIYSTPVEAPAGEVLYDAASPGGPPPPLPTTGGGQPPPGEELYSLATEGAALHVQSAGAGQQFVVPMAEGDGGGAAHSVEETIYSSALEAPQGEALYDEASAGDPTAFRAQAATGANFMIPMEDATADEPPPLPTKAADGH